MVQFRWIKMISFVILVLQFTVLTGQNSLSFTVRAGGEVTLPCENVIKNQDKCDRTSWLSSDYIEAPTRELINLGQISKSVISKAKSNRLSVTAECSLVIKNVTREDVGRYTCRQFNKSGKPQGQDAHVFLSVINMTEHENDYMVILYCSVLTYEGCGHTVEWLYEGNKNDVTITPYACSATVEFTPHLNQKSKYYELLKCNVTDSKNGKMQLCNVGPESSCGKTGWLLYIIVAVGLAAFLAAVIVVAVIRKKRTKGNKTQMDENIGLSLNTAVSPETNQDTADPEEVVSYASISYIKKTNSKAQGLVKGDDDDEGYAVTYSTVKASPSSAAGTSADPSNLYATINRPDN